MKNVVQIGLLLAIVSSLNAGLIGKGGLSDWKLLAKGNSKIIYRIYCNEKNSMFSLANHEKITYKNGKWYRTLDNDKYMGRSYDGLDVNQFGEKVCR